MPHKLMLELPEDVFQPLQEIANRCGKTPEQLAIEWLRASGLQAACDPLEEFIGAFPSNIPDWADQHDKYFGQTLMEQPGKENKTGT